MPDLFIEETPFFTDEHRRLAASVANFVAAEVETRAVEGEERGEDEHFREMLGLLAQSGILSYAVPQLDNTPPLDLRSLCLIREALASDIHGRNYAVPGLADPDAGELLAHVDAVFFDANRVAFLDLQQQERPHPVDQRNAHLDQDQRPEIRITPGDRAARVDDRGHAAGNQPLGRDAVEVLVVDDGNLAGLQSLEELLRPAIDPSETLGAPKAPS